ncbi:MAG: threonine--tRNA ligase [Candidatus Aminicenantes bacterium]|nr:MAG: threonine--tRNA ligase [Candidatus Aminicenantes bacterium]
MDELVKITIEGSTLSAEKGTSLTDLIPRLKLDHKPLFAKIDALVVGLDTQLEKDMEIKLIYADSDEALDILRHSAAHLLAHAVLELFPGTQTGIGPAVEDGFFYDFLRDTPFTLQDLSEIEAKMRELAKKDILIKRDIFSKKEALRVFKKMGQDLKVELIQEKAGEQVICYRQEGFIDFCLGPHVSSTGLIKHFKLLSVSGAYWRGDEKGKQLQRIYGVVFFEKKELEEYLVLLEEAKKRDHRKLGPELDLFSFNEDLGAGLVLWHPKGATIRHIIENYWREEHVRDGYDFICAPHLAKLDVWRRSGHTEFYEAMYPPMQFGGIEYELKPMNCPFHIMVYKSKQRSYRDLPLRWAELGTVYRNERSGVLHGLLRVRGFTVDDAHIFCRTDQLEEEIKRVIFLALRLLNAFGFNEYDVFLSTRPEKYVGTIEDWDRATQALDKALKDAKMDFKVDEGEGVFYGPKIDIKVKDVLRRSWQCTTIQLDFNLAERFDVNYVGEDGQPHRPFLIHRALLGSLERFFGVLIEHYNGNFPIWLAPIQVVIIPVAERHNDYAASMDKKFKENGLRSSVDLRREKVGYKVRDAEINKISLILVVGDKEVTNGTASLRIHTVGDRGEISVDVFLEKVKELDKNKSLAVNF